MEQTFGGFVRQRRSSMGITLRGLAARLGLSPVYMSNIETDRKPAPTQEYLEKLEVSAGSGCKVQGTVCIGRPSGVYHGAGYCAGRPADS